MFGGMVFFEIILVMDCRIKMSLLTFRSHSKRRSVSLTGVQTITSHVLTFKACTPWHAYTVSCWLKRWKRVKKSCPSLNILTLVAWSHDRWWYVTFQIRYPLCMTYLTLSSNAAHCTTGIYCAIVSHYGIQRSLWRKTTVKINSNSTDKNRFSTGFTLKGAASVTLISSHDIENLFNLSWNVSHLRPHGGKM